MAQVRSSSRAVAASAVLVPAGAAASLTFLDYDAAPLWRDEVYTLSTAGRGLPQMLHLVLTRDAGLLGYYVLMHPVLAVSHATWWIRLPSALASILLTVLVAVLARRLAGSATALVAGLLCAVSPVVYVHAQEARPYPLVLCAVVATALLLPWDSDERGPGRRRWLGAGATAVLAALLHPLVALPALGALFATAWFRLPSDQRRCLTVTAAPAGAVGCVLVLVGSAQAVASPPAKATAAEYAGFWRIAADAPWSGWTLLILAAAGAVIVWRRSAGTGASLVAWALAPVLAVTALGLVGSYFNTRYASAASPAVCILVGVALVRASRWLAHRGNEGTATRTRTAAASTAAAAALVPAVVIAVLLPAPIAFRGQPYIWDDPKGAADQLQAQSASGDAVVFLGNVTRPLVSAYAPPGLLGGRLEDALLLAPAQQSATLGGLEVPAACRLAVLATHPRVWLVGSVATATRDLGRSTPSARAVMADRQLISRTDHGHLRVELWAVPRSQP